MQILFLTFRSYFNIHNLVARNHKYIISTIYCTTATDIIGYNFVLVIRFGKNIIGIFMELIMET